MDQVANELCTLVQVLARDDKRRSPGGDACRDGSHRQQALVLGRDGLLQGHGQSRGLALGNATRKVAREHVDAEGLAQRRTSLGPLGLVKGEFNQLKVGDGRPELVVVQGQLRGEIRGVKLQELRNVGDVELVGQLARRGGL